ncbi:MAG: N-acetylneuraminate synthase [Dehalococcoidales bacterium]|nr:N-acetylneuraminate synthase [Dehalococcoidales bacterium]
MELPPEIISSPHTLIIAEAGVNHNGNLEMALKLCDAAKAAGADIVKFQTWKTSSLMLRNTPVPAYQKDAAAPYDSQYAMLEALELPWDAFRHIKAHCITVGIRFLSTPDEEESLDFLVDDLGLDMVKIGSGEVTNLPFLAQVGQKGVEVILSTGMATPGEVATAWQTLQQYGAPKVSLLHCTSNYPAPMEEVNLKAMLSLRERFHATTGYSDHTEGIEVAVAAVALGAEIIEKHLTLDRSLPGPDHRSSIEPDQFKAMVQAIRNIEKALGDGIKRIQPSEAGVRKVVQKRLVARVPIAKGEPFTSANVTAKRAGRGIPASNWLSVEGKPAPRDYMPDECIDQP